MMLEQEIIALNGAGFSRSRIAEMLSVHRERVAAVLDAAGFVAVDARERIAPMWNADTARRRALIHKRAVLGARLTRLGQ